MREIIFKNVIIFIDTFFKKIENNKNSMRISEKFYLVYIKIVQDGPNFPEEKDFVFIYSHPEKNKISNSYEKTK